MRDLFNNKGSTTKTMIYLDITGKYNKYCKKPYITPEYAFFEQVKREHKGAECKKLKRRFRTEDDYVESVEYITGLSNRILSVMTDSYAKLFDISITECQMRIIIGSWLFSFLYQFYDHYLAIKEIEGKDIFTIGLAPRFYDGLEYDSDVFFEYHTKLYTFLCMEFGFKVKIMPNPSKQRRLVERALNLLRYPRYYPYYFEKIERRCKRLSSKSDRENNQYKKTADKYKLNTTYEIILLRTNFLEETKSHILAAGNGRIGEITEDEINQMFSGVKLTGKDMTIREKQLFDGFSAENEYEIFVKKLLPEIIPVYLLENFEKVYRQALSITREWNTKHIYTTECGGTIYTKMLLAAMAEKVEMHNIQHSGMLGYHECGSFQERIVGIEMLTWGWNSEFCFGSVRPVAMSRVNPKSEKDAKKGRYLFITNAADSVFERGFGTNYESFCINHFKFIDELPKEIRKKIVVRVEMYEQMNAVKYKYATKYKDITLSDRSKRPFEDDVQMSELVICDIVSSSHLEALVLGMPVLFFDACSVNLTNKEIEQKLENLHKVGVYAKRPEELADTIMKIEGNINVWWNEPVRQQAIKDYLRVSAHDAYGKENCWVNEITRKLINGKAGSV